MKTYLYCSPSENKNSEKTASESILEIDFWRILQISAPGQLHYIEVWTLDYNIQVLLARISNRKEFKFKPKVSTLSQLTDTLKYS